MGAERVDVKQPMLLNDNMAVVNSVMCCIGIAKTTMLDVLDYTILAII